MSPRKESLSVPAHWEKMLDTVDFPEPKEKRANFYV